MEGVYVDSDFRLVLVSASASDKEGKTIEWDIYGVRDNTGWNGKATRSTASPKWIDFTRTDGTTKKIIRGTFDGVDRVVWDDGLKWNRIEASVDQFRILTYRPYVPLTLVFLVGIRLLFVWMYTSTSKVAAKVCGATTHIHKASDQLLGKCK